MFSWNGRAGLRTRRIELTPSHQERGEYMRVKIMVMRSITSFLFLFREILLATDPHRRTQTIWAHSRNRREQRV